jgi:hypothetical protein
MYDRYQDWRLDVDNMTYEVCILSLLLYLAPFILPLPSDDDQTLLFAGVARARRQNWVCQHRVA